MMNQANKNLQIFMTLNILICSNFVIAKNMTSVDLFALNSAVRFSEKWISTPKQYSGVVFPSTVLLQMKNATKLMQRIRNIAKTNTYYLFGSDLEMFNNSKYCQNELLWFPFDLESYHTHCQHLGFSSKATTQQNIFFSLQKTLIEPFLSLKAVKFNLMTML